MHEPERQFEHIVMYQINDKTGERRLAYDDAKDEGREYAEKGNSAVAKARTLWEQGGKIRAPKDHKDVDWLDAEYAPHGDFEDLIISVERDDTMQEALDDNPQVKQAWEHFVTSVKLTKNL